MLKKILPVLITLAIVHNTPTAWAAEAPKTDSFYLPKSLDLSPLRLHNIESNPYGKDFNYAQQFKTLDLEAVKKDIKTVLTTSQDWWPADYGNYGPFFIRMAWHGAEPTAYMMAVVVPMAGSKDLSHSIAGQITPTLIKRVGFCGL
ncbi:hypothetical protein ADT46_01400 [Yersinia pestis subsp. microtus bv. Caucasica]|nr:hypothetical protein ADT46_01400 [Yersinia pestis subsp. microtus bv. Caucasica]